MQFVVVILIAALGALSFPFPVHAQKIVFNQGFSVSEDQKLMFSAAKKAVNKEYGEAEALYTRAIAINGNNAEAYLQRGFIRREMKNDRGAAADGRVVVNMSNALLQSSPNNASLYYRRGMGNRLTRDFTAAKQDIRRAIRLNNKKAVWRNDLKAVELEEKTAR